MQSNNETTAKERQYYSVSYIESTVQPSNRTTHNYSGKTTGQSDRTRYVSFDNCIKDGRRLGNLLFDLAAVIFVAELAGRKAVLEKTMNIALEKVFKLNMERVENLCPCHVIGESHHLAYDINTEKIAFNDPTIWNKTILVAGFRQSWKYTLSIERRLRKHLVFRDEIQNFTDNYFQEVIPSGWKRVGFVRVGIHCRRGDINVVQNFVKYGYTVPSETYFYKAMKYFTDKYSRVQFIVTSDDSNWTHAHIVNANNIPSNAINITYTAGNTAGQDFAILSMCDHVIMSTGTYGWWAAWIAKGTTIYYSDWPRKGSPLAGQFKREDFFPPNWIPMANDK